MILFTEARARKHIWVKLASRTFRRTKKRTCLSCRPSYSEFLFKESLRTNRRTETKVGVSLKVKLDVGIEVRILTAALPVKINPCRSVEIPLNQLCFCF